MFGFLCDVGQHTYPHKMSKKTPASPTTAVQAPPVPVAPITPAAATDTVAATVKALHRADRSKGRALRSLRFWVMVIAIYQVVFASGLFTQFIEYNNDLVWFNSPELAVGQYMNASVCTGRGTELKKMLFPKPVRRKDQIMIRVEKAAGNPVDFKMRLQGVFPLKQAPFISGYDFAGHVVETSPESRFKLGQRVFGMLPPTSPKWGTFAEYVAVDESFVAVVPENVTMSEAAAMPLASITALQALAKLGPVIEGESILIHAGSGGVGTYAIQFAAQLLKLKVYTTSTNTELCKSLGAYRVINYRTEDFTNFGDFDYVIDLMGGDYLVRGYRKCAKHYITILNSGWDQYFGHAAFIFPGELFNNLVFRTMNLLTWGYYPKYETAVVRSNGAQLQMIAEWVQQGKVRVVLDGEDLHGLDKAPNVVHQRLEAGRAKGKIVLSIE